MKIHIVKKGDTLWKIAEMYDVDYEELKQMNAHLAEPDMIMPGMKIRVPVNKKATKKDHTPAKEEKKEAKKSKEKPKEQMKKPQPTKPMKEVEEDDDQDHIDIQPVIPFEQQQSPSLHKNTMPKMPSMPKMPQMAPMEEAEKEKPKEKNKEKVKEQPVKEKEEESQQEMKNEKMPLTSHGCYCYCGTCSPAHFKGAQMMPQPHQQMPMHLMYPSHSCGCQQPMMHGYHHMMHGMQPTQTPTHAQMHGPTHAQMHAQMQAPMMNEQHMPQGMMSPNHMSPNQMPQGMMDPTHQPMPLSYYENQANMQGYSNQQMHPQQPESIPGSWQREEVQVETERSVEQTEQPNENSVRQSYPPMYSEQSTYYSYPQPPEFNTEE